MMQSTAAQPSPGVCHGNKPAIAIHHRKAGLRGRHRFGKFLTLATDLVEMRPFLSG
jgi:hypothetical protein